jgi:hypothetical protein
VVSVAVVAFAAACSQPPATSYQITLTQPDDAATIVTRGDTLWIDVHSPQGIGSLSVSGSCGLEIDALSLRLHLQGLEGLRFSWADSAVRVSVPSSDPEQLHEELYGAGTTPPQALDAASPYWMPVRLRTASGAAPKIPLTDGWFEVDAPRSYLASWRGSFVVEWVDFYQVSRRAARRLAGREAARGVRCCDAL